MSGLGGLNKSAHGVVVGLVAGKLIGITGATWLVQRTGLGRLSPGLTLRRVAGGYFGQRRVSSVLLR